MRAKEFLLERWTANTVKDYFDSQTGNQVKKSSVSVSQPMPGCILLTFKSIPDLTRCFFRLSEFANSEQNVDMVDFLDQWIDREGQADYFKFWDGFNITDQRFESWVKKTRGFSQAEQVLIDIVKNKKPNTQKWCVLGITTDDPATRTHELFHAKYYLDAEFKHKVDQLKAEFKRDSAYKVMAKTLKQRLDYIKNIDEEIAAYLCAGSQIKMVFGIECRPWVKKFQELGK